MNRLIQRVHERRYLQQWVLRGTPLCAGHMTRVVSVVDADRGLRKPGT